MKNKLKFATLLTMLLVAAPMFAQDVNKNVMTRAQNRIDNMSQSITLNDATKQKALDLTYKQMSETNELATKKNKGEMTDEEFRAALKEVNDDYWAEMLALIPREQRATYNEWRKKPGNERDAAPAK